MTVVPQAQFQEFQSVPTHHFDHLTIPVPQLIQSKAQPRPDVPFYKPQLRFPNPSPTNPLTLARHNEPNRKGDKKRCRAVGGLSFRNGTYIIASKWSTSEGRALFTLQKDRRGVFEVSLPLRVLERHFGLFERRPRRRFEWFLWSRTLITKGTFIIAARYSWKATTCVYLSGVI